MTSEIHHPTVLLDEAVEALAPQSGKVYVDGTLGGGGHAQRLATLLDAESTLIGLDQDPIALKYAEQRLQEVIPALHLVEGNFGSLIESLLQVGVTSISGGLLLDLGVSSFQLEDASRGFSFQSDSALDMRMSPQLDTTAADLVNTMTPEALADVLYQYGEERFSRQIAAAIERQRPIETTAQLARVVESVYHKKGSQSHHIHPATRTFMALRIAVNKELDMLERCLQQLPRVMASGARVAIISFHSLEDRMVKHYFREASTTCICPPRQPVCNCNHQPTFKRIGKPIRATDAEVEKNPRARSAMLRVAERL